MKFSTTFLRAHELLATGQERYTCDAILRAHGGKAPGALLWYRAYFKPYPEAPRDYWLDVMGMSKQARIAWRLTALCFAATITKSEGI